MWRIKHWTCVDCRLKHHNLKDTIFAVIYFHFYTFSKLRILYTFFLVTFLAGSNLINLKSDRKIIISFTYKRSFTEILDVNKLRLRYKKFQGEMTEMAHPIFDWKVRYIFHSDINLNLQPLKSNLRNSNFC